MQDPRYPISFHCALALLIAVPVLSCWLACANPLPPSGGPKDTSPPVLITETSTPNYLIHFDRREIVLTFDEWIQLKEQQTQIVISPPLVRRPEITLKGKSVIIRFHAEEVLRDETTYLINFGGAIADLNEGNVLDQFKFVFSTGSFIDSLQVRGVVIDAATGEPVKNVLIILHDDLSDTAMTSVLPAYFGKSNVSGEWTIENIRIGVFNLYALVDVNFNYRYDQQGEQVGFLGKQIVLPDTTDTEYRIVLFTEDPLVQVLDADRRTPGVTRLTMSAANRELTLRAIDASRGTPPWHAAGDSVLIWHSTSDSIQLMIMDNGAPVDTVWLRPMSGAARHPGPATLVKRVLHPAELLIIENKTPLRTIDTAGVMCIQGDTVMLSGLVVQIDSIDTRRLTIGHRWLGQERYRCIVLPGAMQDIFGFANDSINVQFQIAPVSQFGEVFVEVTDLADTVQYLVQLMSIQNQLLQQHIIHDVPRARVQFSRLQPQAYKVRIVEDINRNGTWDTGKLSQHRQPERVLLHTLEPLRAGWDLEATISWQDKSY